MKRWSMVIVAGIVVIGSMSVGVVKALSGSGQKSSVGVVLKEMRVISKTNRVNSGKVTFVVRNAGSIEHELVVLRARRGLKLPIRNYKAVEGNAVVGEVDGLGPGKTGRVTLSLKRGTYLLICNEPGHYQLGMSSVLKVA